MGKLVSPILILAYNRVDKLQKLISSISNEFTSRIIHISVDGPLKNKPEDVQKVAAVRNYVESLRNRHNLRVLLHEDNLGCKQGVIRGINWFFENSESGIILEDDCIPDNSFFSFCDTLLKKYATYDKVMHIGGSTAVSSSRLKYPNYYFSKLPPIWGWATWRRAWKLMDADMNNYEPILGSTYWEKVIPDEKVRRFYHGLFESVKQGEVDTWDYQWTYAVMKHGLAAVPYRNLISNIGFDNDATHTKSANSRFANLPTSSIGMPRHPLIIKRNVSQDMKVFQSLINK